MGRKINIEIKEEVSELAKWYKSETDPKAKIRYLAFIHLKEGKNGKEISELIKIKQRTLYNWLKWYKEEGILALKTDKATGRTARLGSELKEEIQALVREKKFSSLEDFTHEINERYAIDYSISGLWRRTRKWDLSWKCGRKSHYKSNPEEQEEFKKKRDNRGI